MTNLVRTELEAAIAADLPDNTEQTITAARLRSACTDLNDTIFRSNAIALADKTGRILLSQGGYLLGAQCLSSATYASTAAAESSGDTWCNGAEITITGGPVFIYYSTLAVSGYSGLIHKEPYGSGNGTFDTATVKASETENSDPDAWTSGWVDSGIGTKGADYDYDTSGGLSRLSDLSSAGMGKMGLDFGSSSASEVFNILDNVSRGSEGGVATVDGLIRLFYTAYKDGTDKIIGELRVERSGTTTNWTVQSLTNTDSGVSRNSATRIYAYMKDGRQTTWFDDDSAPSVNVTNTRSGVGSPGGAVSYTIGGTSISFGLIDMLLGANVLGEMTTV